MGVKVNRQGLADSFGAAPPAIDRWIKQGCPISKRGSRGVEWEFDLADVIRWRVDVAVREATGDGPSNMDAAKLRKMSAEAELAELELAKAVGDVAPIRDFERTTARLMSTIQTNVMNVPARAVLQLLGCTDETEFKTKMRAELTLALEQSAAAEVEIDDADEADDDGE